jgi:site-specific DNA-cytosine methylase
MKVLELFAGTRSIGKAFEAAGHEVFSIDWDKSFDGIDWHADIGTITAEDIIERFGKPDVIWASPDCTTFSIAAISHHRTKTPDGILLPTSDYAKRCDEIDSHVMDLIEELQPKYWFVENPVGGMRKSTFMQPYNKKRHTVTYCQYETDKPASQRRKKPTDIWTNHPCPNFKPACKNGDPCHAAAPRGAKTGTQGLKGSKERSVIPRMLCEHIVYICERRIEDGK